MPFNRTQVVVKNILPPKYYAHVYDIACEVWYVYRRIADNTFYLPKLVKAMLARNEDEIRKITFVQNTLPYSLNSKIGLEHTYDIADNVVKQGIKGAFVECGVARGGSSALMALVAEWEEGNRKTWLFDSFEGLPKQTIEDGEQKPPKHKNKLRNDLAEGYCLGTYGEVERLLFKQLTLDKNQVFMIKGWFKDTLPENRDNIGDIAVLRLDSDWYESTKCCLENLYDNVVVGGFVIVDDYSLKGCKLAVDEFRRSRRLWNSTSFDADGRLYWRKR